MTPSINTVTMEVEAHSRDEALEIARQFCSGAKPTSIPNVYLRMRGDHGTKTIKNQ